MANVTVTTADKNIDEKWMAELNRGVEMDLVVAAKFTDKSSVLPSGDTAHLVSRHHLTADTKSAGSALTPQALTETEQTFVVNTHQGVAQSIEDIAKVQSKYNIRSEYTQEYSYCLARAMDVSAANLFDDNTTQVVGAYGAELGDSDLLDARAYIRNSGGRGGQIVFVPPATYNGFLKVDKFVNQLYNGDQKGRAVNQAQLGKLYESTVYESQLLPGTSPAASGAWFTAGHFFKIVQRSPTFHSWYSPNDLMDVLSADCIYGMFEKLEADEGAGVTTNARLYSVHLRCKK